MVDYATIRKEYSNAELDETMLAPHPIVQFEMWFKQAVEASVPEPNAMHLGTVSADGRPSLRVVLLKGIENSTFIFYTNTRSKKAKELAGNNACAATFYWPELARQIRIEGNISLVSEYAAEQYFNSRPRNAQISAWASPQSEVISGRPELKRRIDKVMFQFRNCAELPKPPDWGGYAIEPVAIEFWQGRQSRLHDRIQYTLVSNSWTVERLAP